MKDNNLQILEENLILLTICRICSEFIGSSIFQCSSGHFFCELCAQRLDNCPSCRVTLPRGGIRSRGLEDIINLLPSILCPQEDCEIRLSYQELQKHYHICNKRTIVCPLSTCSWTGKACSIREHIETAHQDEIIDVDSNITFIVTNKDGYGIDANGERIIRMNKAMSNCKYFVVGFWLIRGHCLPSSLITTVIHLGVNEPNNEIRCISSVYYPQDNYRSSCERTPWHILDNITDICKSRRNLIIDWDLALRIGKVAPTFRNNDQLQRSPLTEGLNIPIEIEFNSQDNSTNNHECPNININLQAIMESDF